MRFAMTLAAAALTAACTMKSQEAPPLTGPSELGTSIVLSVTPDVLNQDGASQSIVTVTARDQNGQPLRNLALRGEINVNGISADFGTLSARNVVTGADGRATFIYTAPPAPPVAVSDQTIVSILVTPIGTDFNNAVSRSATIRLVPAVNVPLPSGMSPNFVFSPEQPTEGQNVFFEACGDPANACAPANNPVVTYSWDFGDGATATGRTVTHAFNGPGNYFVRLTITDSLGRTAPTTRTVPVGQSAAPNAQFVFSPTTAVTGQAVNFNASASTATAGRRIASYTWDFGDGTALETRTSPVVSHTYGAARTYTVTLVVTDDIGRTDSFSATVTVGSPTIAGPR